jgi:hypothetical protein
VQALRRFSDECEAPNLIAECPFSIDLPGGGRGCGEECLLLLEQYRVPPSSGELPAGTGGIGARSMGPPRRPSSDPRRAFDAAECYYRDSDMPDRSRWQTTSLLYDLSNAYVPKPASLRDPERCKRLAAAADELSRRGFDVDALLRNGLRGQLAVALSVVIGMPDLVAAKPTRQLPPDGVPLPQPPDGWPKLLDAFIDAEASSDTDPPPPADAGKLVIARYRMDVATGQFLARVRIWAGVAPVDDLVSLRPPTMEDFLAYEIAREPEMRAAGRRQRWVIDRFTETYLQHWSKESLMLEWRFQHATEEPPCPPREMAARVVDANDLAHALAEAAANPASGTPRGLQSAAVELLREGRSGAAAAVLGAALRTQWENAELHNDLGFCLLPDDPAEALKELETASRLGFPRTVNVCNRILALFMTGSYAAALEVADRAVEGWKDLDRDLSYLWDFRSPEPRLLPRECPRCHILKLAVHVADASGDELAAARWRDIQSRLVGGHAPDIR